MKIPGKRSVFAAGLCAITAAVCIGLYLVHRNHAPGIYGRNLEFRLAAFNTEHVDPFSRAPEGFDVFAGYQAREIAASGVAPAGFKWLPLSKFLLIQGGGVQPRGITCVKDGRDYLLVADQPAMILTHAGNAPRWGVKSIKMTATYDFGPVVKAVQIDLDYPAARILRQFTQKYTGHSVAVVVDGQVIVNEGFLGPFKGNVLGFSFPEGEEAEAEKLRDSLMK